MFTYLHAITSENAQTISTISFFPKRAHNFRLEGEMICQHSQHLALLAGTIVTTWRYKFRFPRFPTTARLFGKTRTQGNPGSQNAAQQEQRLFKQSYRNVNDKSFIFDFWRNHVYLRPVGGGTLNTVCSSGTLLKRSTVFCGIFIVSRKKRRRYEDSIQLNGSTKSLLSEGLMGVSPPLVPNKYRVLLLLFSSQFSPLA